MKKVFIDVAADLSFQLTGKNEPYDLLEENKLKFEQLGGSNDFTGEKSTINL